MKKLLFFTIMTFALFSCEYTNKLKFAETQCSNPWGHSGDPVEQKQLIKDYLLTKEIEVGEIQIIQEYPGMTCAACSCTSGRYIYITVNNEDKSKALALGFTD